MTKKRKRLAASYHRRPSYKTFIVILIILLVLLVLRVTLFLLQKPQVMHERAQVSSATPFRVPYTGTNYAGASVNPHLMAAKNLGKFDKIWLDFGTSGMYPGLDTLLAKFHSYGMKVDLVLNETMPRGAFTNPATRAQYVQAVKKFVTQLAANPIAIQTVAVIDVFNEAYYQLQAQNGFSPANEEKIHQFLIDMVHAGKSAPNGTAFKYTVSNAGGTLLTTNTAKQRRLIRLYDMVDVYDLHVYENSPQLQLSRWQSAANLHKPWFAGETGSGNTQNAGQACYNYNGNDPCLVQIDSWWLNNLAKYGASAVLLENAGEVYKNGQVTGIGKLLQQVTAAPPLNNARLERVLVHGSEHHGHGSGHGLGDP
jgi:hypothetical protein